METLPALRQIEQAVNYLDYVKARGRRVLQHTVFRLWMEATFTRIIGMRYKPRFRFPGRCSYAEKYAKSKAKKKVVEGANGAPDPPGSIDDNLPRCRDAHICI